MSRMEKIYTVLFNSHCLYTTSSAFVDFSGVFFVDY